MKFYYILFVSLIFLAASPAMAQIADPDAICRAYGPTTGCTTFSGQPGHCNTSNVCIADNANPSPTVNPPNPSPTVNPGTSVTLVNPLGSGATLTSFLNSILALVVRIGTIVVILMLVYVGFMFVTARGNETKISEARKALLWTVVGALILLGAQAIALGIQATAQALSTGT